MNYNLSSLANIMGATLIGSNRNAAVADIITDSRSTFYPDRALFFAIVGERHNGHSYIASLYERGVCAFVVSEAQDEKKYPKAAFLQVGDTLKALQTLAAHHRRQFAYPVVAVAGSNGKTIVKEWLTQLLSSQLRIVRSPKSYNSQVGVPLSVWGMDGSAELAVFEAGISLPGEMERLEDILRPDVMLFTNIGEAHQAGFASREQKLREKLKLGVHAEAIVYCADMFELRSAIGTTPAFAGKRIFSWGKSGEADVRLVSVENDEHEMRVVAEIAASKKTYTITIPFTDTASVENAMHSFAACCLLAQQYPQLHINAEVAAANVSRLTPIAMRLALHEGINGCTIINDAYNADVASLRIALDFLSSFGKHRHRTVILSDIEQSGKEGWRLYGEVAELLREHAVSRLIAIGPQLGKHLDKFTCEVQHYASVSQFLRTFSKSSFNSEAILIKGSRSFELERISHQLSRKTHLTTLDVNLTAMADNLNALRAMLRKNVQTLVLVKANAYGTGLCEVARLLQHQRVDYLGVAFADEGVELREHGISLPVLVLNPEPGTFEQMLAYRLEPEIYSLAMLQKFSEAALRMGEGVCSVHIKLDTGMHRMGFAEDEIDELLQALGRFRNVKVASIFSHLAAADEPQHDDFTRSQIARFDAMSTRILDGLGYAAIRHLANSAGVERFPEAQFDMVRIGIALYGASPVAGHEQRFRTVCTLRSTIVQLRRVPAGDTIGYGRCGVATRDMTIAAIPVGYADGLNRLLSNGAGSIAIGDKLVPIVGNICMDVCMADVTDIDVHEGDEVVIFGEKPTLFDIAETLHTIPYEVLTRISTRVKRIYYSE